MSEEKNVPKLRFGSLTVIEKGYVTANVCIEKKG